MRRDWRVVTDRHVYQVLSRTREYVEEFVARRGERLLSAEEVGR